MTLWEDLASSFLPPHIHC